MERRGNSRAIASTRMTARGRTILRVRAVTSRTTSTGRGSGGSSRLDRASSGEVSPLRLRQTQALQPGPQRARMHIEDRRRPATSLDAPTRRLEDLAEVRALVPFEGLEAARSSARSRWDRCRGRQQGGANVYHAPPREHAGPLDDMLQLPNVPRPRVRLQSTQALR